VTAKRRPGYDVFALSSRERSSLALRRPCGPTEPTPPRTYTGVWRSASCLLQRVTDTSTTLWLHQYSAWK